MCIRYRRNVFTEPLSSNVRLFWLHSSGFQALGRDTDTQTSRWSHKLLFIFFKIWKVG
jgi:hypothetical protein